MQLKRCYFYVALIFLQLLNCMPAVAQKGHHVMVWGGPQIVSIANFNDSRGQNLFNDKLSILDRKTTIRAGGGIDYIYNFANSYGIQSGIYYSQQGQKYAGTISPDFNFPGDTNRSTEFTSHIYMDYFRVPLMFRFSSLIEEDDRINLSIFGGLQMGFLRSIQSVYTSPNAPDTMINKYPDFDFKNLYKSTDLGISAGAQFNIMITKKVSTLIGIRWDRSLNDIENKGFKLPKDAPAEWMFPVSVKKSPQTVPDNSTRPETKHTSINLYTGIIFHLNGISPVKAAPVPQQ